MAHQDVTETVQIEIRYVMDQNNAANVLHAKYTGAVSLSDFDNLENAIAAWLTASWAPVASSMWEVNQIILTDLNSLNGPRKSYPISPPIQGTDTAQAMPANATLAVKADVGRRGRGLAGRIFFIGLSEAAVQGNEVVSTGVASILTIYNTLNADIAALPPFDGLAVPHRTVGGAHPNPASSDTVTNFLVTDNLIDSQKDRLPFHKKKRKPRAPVLP
jgi:hypothetical protein